MSHSASSGIKTSFLKFKVALTLVALVLTPATLIHFLLKNIWKLWKLEENPFANFWVMLFTNRRTNLNDYITSAGGCNDTNKTVGDTWHDFLISRSCLTLRQESKARWTKALNLWGRWFETSNLGPVVRKLVVTCWCPVVYSAEYWPTSMYWFLHL